MVDWNLASGNPFAQAVEGFQNGQQLARQRERDKEYGAAVRVQQQRADRQDAEAERRAKLEDEARRLGQVKTVLQGLTSVPEGQRLPAFQKAAPMLARLGLDPSELSTTTEDELSNATLSMLGAQIEDAYKQTYQNDTGIYGVKPTGKVDTLKEFDPKPTIVPQGSVALGRDGKPLFTNPKTFAPPRPSGNVMGAGAPRPSSGINPNQVKWD